MTEPPIKVQSEVQALASEVVELRLALHGFHDMLSHIYGLLDDTVERLEEYLSKRYLEPEPSFEKPVDYSQVPF